MRRVAMAVLQLGTLAAVLGLGKLHAALIGDYDLTDSSRFAWALGFVALCCLTAYAAGLPDLAPDRSALAATAAALASAAVLISVAQLAAGSAQLPRYVVFGAVIVLLPWYSLCAAMASTTRAGGGRDRVIAVVRPEEAETLTRGLANHPERPALLIETQTASEAVGPLQPLVEMADRAEASVVVLDRDAQASDEIVSQAALLHSRGLRIRTLSLFYDEWLGRLPIAELERVALMFDIGEIHRVQYGRLKRLLDVVVAAVGTIVLIAILPFVLVGNLFANRGPLFYRQPRVGKNGREFQILKLRSITPGSSSGEWLDPDDPRVTPFGRWLRRLHLDELPQVLNVLEGDLSMVGPRPEQPTYVAELTEKIPFYDFRHRVRPGLTGWAQVSYPYGDSEVGALEKLQYEFYYLRHQSLSLDLRILARTLRSIVRLEGR